MKLIHQVLVRHPETGQVVGFGPQDNPVPAWVRKELAGAEHLWEKPSTKK